MSGGLTEAIVAASKSGSPDIADAFAYSMALHAAHERAAEWREFYGNEVITWRTKRGEGGCYDWLVMACRPGSTSMRPLAWGYCLTQSNAMTVARRWARFHHWLKVARCEGLHRVPKIIRARVLTA